MLRIFVLVVLVLSVLGARKLVGRSRNATSEIDPQRYPVGPYQRRKFEDCWRFGNNAVASHANEFSALTCPDQRALCRNCENRWTLGKHFDDYTRVRAQCVSKGFAKACRKPGFHSTCSDSSPVPYPRCSPQAQYGTQTKSRRSRGVRNALKEPTSQSDLEPEDRQARGARLGHGAVEKTSCELSTLGRYSCRAQGATDEIARKRKSALFKMTLLAETWACVSQKCACDEVRPALDSVAETSSSELGAKAFSRPEITCEDSIARFEAWARPVDTSCKCHKTFAYENHKGLIRVRELAELERAEHAIVETERKIEYAIQECAPFAATTQGRDSQNKFLKGCVDHICSEIPSQRDAKREGATPVINIIKCQEDAFARGSKHADVLRAETAGARVKHMDARRK